MRATRPILLALLVMTGLTLAACESIEKLTNMLDTKKKLPGDRKPVFPEGVPGVSLGVPPEMMKGYQAQSEQQQQQQQQQAQPGQGAQPQSDKNPVEQAEQKDAEKPKPKKVVVRPKPQA